MTYGKPRAMQPDNRVPPAGPADDWQPLNMQKWAHLRSDTWRRQGGIVTLKDSRDTQTGACDADD